MQNSVEKRKAHFLQKIGRVLRFVIYITYKTKPPQQTM